MTAKTLTLLVLQSAASLAAPAIPGSASPILIHPGPCLFLDDSLIASASNVTRRIMSPARMLAAPVVTAGEDRNLQPYVIILRDTQTQKFRMLYGVPANLGVWHIAHA